MKTKNSSRSGFALAITLVTLLIGTTFVSFYVYRSTHEIRLSTDDVDYQQSFLLAEDGLEYGVQRLADVVLEYQLSPSWSTAQLKAKLDAIHPPNDVGGFTFTAPNGDTAFKIDVDSSIIEGIVTNGTVCKGSFGSYQYLTITCGCRKDGSDIGVVLKQTVQAVGLQLVRFGVFYDQDLEIQPGPTMRFYGPVHGNSDLYLGGPLNFYDRVSSHGNVYRRRKDNPSKRSGTVNIADASGVLRRMQSGGVYYDSDCPDFMTKAIERWNGNLMTKAHGIPKLSPPVNPVDDYHDIIERPNTTNPPATSIERQVPASIYNQKTENEKFSNKACLIIHVKANGTILATDANGNDVSSALTNAVLKTNGSWNGKPTYAKHSDSTYKFAPGGEGSIDITQSNFYDGRQKAYMAPVDIYAEELLNNFPALYDGTFSVKDGRGVVYVTRDDPDGANHGVQPCVRVRNGKDISASPYGLSIVTDLPMYVEGDYNTESTRPALLAGDAVTLLSKKWQDAKSKATKDKRIPINTDYNVVIMTGNSETTVGHYNGGLENVMRFLEKWTGKTAHFRGSIIDLWYAELATGAWNSSYYSPPRRDWGYDTIYRTQSPPGMTRVFGMEELAWSHSSWKKEGWDN